MTALLVGCSGDDPPAPVAPQTATPPPAAAPLAGLVDDCIEGDLAVCDELYEQAAAGSAEELVGDTCGGRQLAGTTAWCVDAAGLADGGDGSAPAAPLAGMVDDCLEGDLAVCDELYEQAAAGSAEELVGDTCGGRQLAGTTAWCVDAPGLADGEAGQASDAVTGQQGSLFAACLQGVLEACDELYRQAAPGTAAQLVGDTCGGRQLVGTGSWCVDEPGLAQQQAVPTSVEPVGSRELLLVACLDGDLEACDDLYVGSDLGTAARVVGDTCGGRQLAGTGQWCAGEAPRPPEDEIIPIGPDEALLMVGWCVDGDLGVCSRLPLDPDLYSLLDDCVNGDSEACDLLLMASVPGSLEELVGDTCGGRQPYGAGAWCVDAEGG